MKRIIFIVFLAFAWTFASAQKIAIIDITQVLENLSEYKSSGSIGQNYCHLETRNLRIKG